MVWNVEWTTVRTNDRGELDKLLAEGWEPFGATMSTILPIIWLRKQVEEEEDGNMSTL